MNSGERWRLRWRDPPRAWLRERSRLLTPTRSRAERFALDRALQRIAQFPYSGLWCGTRYDTLLDMPETYRLMTLGDLVLFYGIFEHERIILFVHAQTTAMDAPRPKCSPAIA